MVIISIILFLLKAFAVVVGIFFVLGLIANIILD